MFKSFLIVLLLLTGLHLSAQTNLDSLYSVWKDEAKTDSLRSAAFEEYISYGYLESDHDSVILAADTLINFGIKQNYVMAKSYGYRLKGDSYYYEGKYTQALENFKVALSIAESTDHEKYKGRLMNSIGVLYGVLGDQSQELVFYERALKVSEEIDDKENMEMCVSNIGEIYFELGNYPRALEYLESGLQLEKEMDDKEGYATSLNLIANVFRKQQDFSRAINYSEQAMKINEEFGFTAGIAESYFSIGDTYKEQKKYVLALQYFNNILKITEGKESSEFYFQSLNKIGSIHNEQGEYLKALSYCKQSLKLSSKMKILSVQKKDCECLYLAYRSLNNDNYALKYLEQMRAIDISMNTQKTNNRLQQMEIEKQVLKDSIATAEKERLIEITHQREVQKKNRTKNIAIVVGLFILLIAAGLFSRWRSVRKSKAIIEKEKDRSESLLLNILPAEIAEELKAKGSADARDFDMATILFTDFKEFTKASEKLTAKALIEEINVCFMAFDYICETYGIEKIKTIGDAYMASGGLPIPSQGSIKNTVLAALEMQSFISNRIIEKDKLNEMSFKMRLGIHTGPVVAGIVGVKKFQYDIWGDTVNTASRMESSGEIGKVNISEKTYALLKDDPEFTFESRGKIDVKGKGEMEMYFVETKLK